jgi:23S rRNA pseudouridine1911/1915/1917 synthase
MHSVPLKKTFSAEKTLLDWCAERFPEVRSVRGTLPWEGGMLHRLDYETQGLALFAKTQRAFDALTAQQETGRFVKEYAAAGAPAERLAGFPPDPPPPEARVIESGFRAFGPGRQAVRPVLGSGRSYITEIRFFKAETLGRFFRLRLFRGFRHQIRCHLAWLGFPILNDSLYGGRRDGSDILALQAEAIAFFDPSSGAPCRYRIPNKGLEKNLRIL